MEPILNDCLSTVFKVKDILKTFIDLNDIENKSLLQVAIDLLDSTEETLANHQRRSL